MRKVGVVSFTMMAVLLMGAMTAWACTNLATLNLSEGSGQAGTTIDVTGSSFRTADRGGQDVLIRWDATDGAVLATATVDDTGSIATSVEIPADAQAGYHVLVATQEAISEDGEVSVAYGTPARASFLVGGALPADAGASQAAPVASTAETSSSGLIILTILLAVAGIGLFGAGLGLFVREVRQRQAVPAPVEKE